MQKSTKFLVWIFVSIFIIYTIGFLIRFNFRTPYYMVFIVPNHGGINAPASATNGDWYNPVLNRYMQPYKEGLYYNGISEFGKLLKLSYRIAKTLEKTKHNSEWKEFKDILIKYGKNKEYDKIILDPELTKKESYKSLRRESDVNKFFRIMDFYKKGIFGGRKKGIISYINKFKAEFVITLDLNYGGENDNSIYTILTPSYNFYNYVRNKIIENELEFDKYTNIVNNYSGKTHEEKIKNIIRDTWLYFTGHLPDKTLLSSDTNKFIGLGYNMVTWDWNDGSRWYKHYEDKDEYPWYNISLKKFIPGGEFWEKEQSSYELWKREKSNFDRGDVYYAAEQFLNIMKSLLNNKNLRFSKPVYSFNPFTLYTTSIVINLNLGSIYDKNNVLFSEETLNKLKNALALGFYSICNGYELKNGYKIQKIDFLKYQEDKYIGRRKKRY